MSSGRDLILAVYTAFNQRDIEAVFRWMHPDVDWPNAMEGIRVHGKDEIRAYWTRQWAMVDPTSSPLRSKTPSQGKP